MSSAYPFAKLVASFVAAAALASCAHAAAPSRSETPRNSVPTRAFAAFENLPRFQRLWTREGLGRFEGVVHDGAYYAIANDGRSARAVDVTSGNTLWQSPLPTPTTDESGRAQFVDGSVIFAYEFDEAKKRDPLDERTWPTRAVVVRLSASDGRVSWSNIVECSNVDSQSSAGRLYLVCRKRPSRWEPSVVRELDPKTGAELASVALSGPFGFSASGEICGLSEKSVWCGRISRSGVQILWRQRSNASPRFDRLQVRGDFVIEHAGDQVVVRHVRDGRVAWKRAHVYTIRAHETAGVAILEDSGYGPPSVVRLSDGAPIAKIPINEVLGGGRLFLSDGKLTLLDVPGVPADRVYLLDSKARVQPIARNIRFFEGVCRDGYLCRGGDVSRGVLLVRNVGSASVNIAVGPLEAYSLTEFAPPHNRLGPYDKVVSVLEVFPSPEYTTNAAPRLRKIPGFMQSLEKIIASSSTQLKSSAIAVAGLTGDARFVPLLRRELDRARPPEGVEQWAPIVDVVFALTNIDSPDAASALFDFWRRMGPKLSPPGRRSILRDAVASAIWRHSALGQSVSCPDVVFASSHADPNRALIGTDSPGVEYAVDARRQWAAICEARTDDDGNGRLEVLAMQMYHDDFVRGRAGDELEPYLVIGSGPGTPIDDFVAADPTGRWIVVTKGMCVYLVDARDGHASALKGADGSAGDTVTWPHRAASFSADGNELLYIRSDGSRAAVIQRNLQSGHERRIDPGAGELRRTFFDRSGRFVVMDVVVRDADEGASLRAQRLATKLRTLRARRCRGPAAWWSADRQIGEVQRIAAVTGGPVEIAPKTTPFEPPARRSSRYELVPRAPAPRVAEATRPLPQSPLPFGPFHWQPRR